MSTVISFKNPKTPNLFFFVFKPTESLRLYNIKSFPKFFIKTDLMYNNIAKVFFRFLQTNSVNGFNS